METPPGNNHIDIIKNNNNSDSLVAADKVFHDYHDYAHEPEGAGGAANRSSSPAKLVNRGEQNFPVKLHYMLSDMENDGLDHIVSWQSHGRCFVVHKQKEFVEHVLPLWFRQSKFPSFQRQLNLYGFKRLTTGRDKGGYYHELFLRGKRFLAHRIQRIKVKGTGARKPSSPETEPNFYLAHYLPATKLERKIVSGGEGGVGGGAGEGLLHPMPTMLPPHGTLLQQQHQHQQQMVAAAAAASGGGGAPRLSLQQLLMNYSMNPAATMRPMLPNANFLMEAQKSAASRSSMNHHPPTTMDPMMMHHRAMLANLSQQQQQQQQHLSSSGRDESVSSTALAARGGGESNHNNYNGGGGGGAPFLPNPAMWAFYNGNGNNNMFR